MIINHEKESAVAVIPDDQVSIAIGKGGLNRRLTSRLTGYNVEILKESEYRAMVQEQKEREISLDQLDGLTPSIAKKLEASGIHSVRDIVARGREGLLEIPGIGDKTVEKILEIVNT